MQSPYVLHVYRAKSGQVSGRLYSGALEVASVAGCASIKEAKEAIEDNYPYEVVFIVDAESGEALTIDS
jgi:hypothetical protein